MYEGGSKNVLLKKKPLKNNVWNTSKTINYWSTHTHTQYANCLQPFRELNHFSDGFEKYLRIDWIVLLSLTKKHEKFNIFFSIVIVVLRFRILIWFIHFNCMFPLMAFSHLNLKEFKQNDDSTTTVAAAADHTDVNIFVCGDWGGGGGHEESIKCIIVEANGTSNTNYTKKCV